MTCRAVLVLVCLVCAAASPAVAQTGAARGEALFKQGMELRARGKVAEACDAFDASEKADPNLGTLMNLADCREMLNELATAWAFFLEAEKRTRYATDDEGKLINTSAKDRAAQLEPRLSKLTLVVPPASRLDGLEITVSKEPFPASSWNLTVPVDGKTHTITARAPGRIEWTTTVTIEIERDSKTVDVPVLERTPEPLPPPATTVIIERPSGLRRAAPYAIAAVSVGAFVGAIAFERWSRNNYDAASAEPEDAVQTRLWERAKDQRAKALGFTAGGLALAGVAVWLWLRDSSEPAPSATRMPTTTAINPVVGPAFTGVVIGRPW